MCTVLCGICGVYSTFFLAVGPSCMSVVTLGVFTTAVFIIQVIIEETNRKTLPSNGAPKALDMASLPSQC